MMDEARDKQKHTLNDAAQQDLSISMLETILRYKDNLKDPQMRAEMKQAIDRHNAALMEAELKTENDKIISTSHLEKSISRFQMEMEKHLKEDRNYSFGDPGSLGNRLLKFLNKNYKGTNIWVALGRVFMETSQAWAILFTEKMDQITSFRLPEWLKIPDAGNLNKDIKYDAREFVKDNWNMFWSNLLTSEDWKMARLFNKPTDFVFELQNWIMNKFVWKIENRLQHLIFRKKYAEKAMEMQKEYFHKMFIDGKISKQTYDEKIADIHPMNLSEDSLWVWFLFKDNITSGNRIRKNQIAEEIRRKSRTEASKLFFDYAENPLYVQKMEQLVPFTNYMYSGVRMLSRYPKSMLFTATMLNNLQYAYGEEVFYTDDQGEKVDAGLALRFPILAAVGLWWVGLNIQRFMQFSPASTGLNPLPIVSFLTNREDFRFKDFYEKGGEWELIDVALTTLGGSIGRIFKWAKNLNDPYQKWYNPVKDITEPLAYMLTGMPIRDKTQQLAWNKLIEDQDYDFLLSLTDLQLNQWFKHPSNSAKWWDRKALEAAKVAKDMGLLGGEDESKWERALLTAITGLGIDPKVYDPKEYQHTMDMMENLLDITTWPAFSKEGDGFNLFLSRAETFIKDPKFKHFEKFNKKLSDTYKHYGELAPWYRQQNDARKLQWEDDTRLKGTAKMFALRYRFEGDEGMTFDQKTSYIMSGKLKKVIMLPENNGMWLPAWPAMTEEYLRTLDHKWPYVREYMKQANNVIALEKARKLFFQLGFAQTSTSKKQEYFDLANSVYNKERKAFDDFKRSWTMEYELYMLSDDAQSLTDRLEKWNEYIQNQYKQKAKVEASKFDRLVSTSSKEKEALAVTLGLNVDEKAIQKAREMLSDSNNKYYYQYTKNPEKLSSIINSIQ